MAHKSKFYVYSLQYLPLFCFVFCGTFHFRGKIKHRKKKSHTLLLCVNISNKKNKYGA